jgi:hypothetical protein
LVIFKVAMKFSEGRWTSASPSAAYFAIWNLISGLGALCMRRFAFQRTKDAAASKSTTETGPTHTS